ncbi:hypothetical protein M7I_5390 [Glarea lozoyensis 74030]|uniref:Uncharacterized protein n=1 Tax=Glarea lozoyensis (strain ATCC 74030 / MF5533) TaxID=1104152 RepID=H0ERR9_GLAL7|nr:hypothetical protein M7I_5390 [Glarea lozoyensis 74030]
MADKVVQVVQAHTLHLLDNTNLHREVNQVTEDQDPKTIPTLLHRKVPTHHHLKEAILVAPLNTLETFHSHITAIWKVVCMVILNIKDSQQLCMVVLEVLLVAVKVQSAVMERLVVDMVGMVVSPEANNRTDDHIHDLL